MTPPPYHPADIANFSGICYAVSGNRKAVERSNMQDYDELMDLSFNVGYRLLENGAETYRVEESIGRILTAYGIIGGEVFAIPSCIIVTIRTDSAGRSQFYTRMKRIYTRVTNLDRVSRLNDICRKICRDTPDCSEACSRIEQIALEKGYPFWARLLSFAMISFGFSLFWGGSLSDALWAALCGMGLGWSLAGMGKFQTNWFFAHIAGSAVVASIAFAGLKLGACAHLDKVIIGTLMNLVPGSAITNGMRDIIAGDLLSGIIKLTEALMVAVGIAIGTGVVLYALGRLM